MGGGGHKHPLGGGQGPPAPPPRSDGTVQPHKSINYIAVRNLQRFSDRSFVTASEPIIILKLD